MKQSLKVGISGVRGIVGPSLSPRIVSAFAQAFGTYVGRGPIVVGRDTRSTGFMLEQAVVAGLQSVGCKPLLAGVVPTPTVQIITRNLGARGGICITASHNAAPWNALKFVDGAGIFLNDEKAGELFDHYHQRDFSMVADHEIRSCSTLPDPFLVHAERVARYVDIEKIRAASFTVAVDCCNGVGALHSVPFLTDVLGCKVVPLNDAVTGYFEREPEPMPEHLGALCRTVTEQGCDVGFAQDPDGDRLAIVNESGKAIGEDLTVALAVQQVLGHHERGPVVLNISTSRCVEAAARACSSEVIWTQIGEIHVVQEMLASASPVGGENNGGVIVPSIHPCRDSFTAMALVLERMATEQKSISQLVNALPACYVVKRKCAIRGDRVRQVLRGLRHHYKNHPTNNLDGLHVDFGDGWLLVRPSNTEPVLRVVAEATSEEQAATLASACIAEVERLTA